MSPSTGPSRPLANTKRLRTSESRRWSKKAQRSKESRRRTSSIPKPTTNLMAISVVMPALEMAQETGKLLAWRKKEGEAVKKGEPLLEIETDKAVVEIEAPGDGILAGITAHEGAVIPVGETIAWLLAAGERAPAAKSPAMASGRATSAAPAAERAAAAARGAAAAVAPAQTSAQIS